MYLVFNRLKERSVFPSLLATNCKSQLHNVVLDVISVAPPSGVCKHLGYKVEAGWQTSHDHRHRRGNRTLDTAPIVRALLHDCVYQDL